eukprot:scaffold84530_cov61-Cyclotella_meneghiniana.AAC.3
MALALPIPVIQMTAKNTLSIVDNESKTSLQNSIAVPSILSIPAANDYQERIFSICQWMDVQRRGKAKDSRFEMSVLIAVNEVLLKSEVSSDEEAQAIVEKVSEMFNYSCIGIDPDDANFIDAYDDTNHGIGLG